MMLGLRMAVRVVTLLTLLSASPGVIALPLRASTALRAQPASALDASLIRTLPAWFDHAQAAESSALPDWFVFDNESGGNERMDDEPAQDSLPAWFASGDGDLPLNSAAQHPLPAWFTAGESASGDAPETGDEGGRSEFLADGDSHHTIYPNQIIVTVAPQTINLCDPLTVTVVAANDSVTTTGVLLTVTLPGGFANNAQAFNIGTVAPDEVITRTAVFTATCSAVSGQAIVTLTQDAYVPITKFAEFVVNPGAITVRKTPSVVPAAIGDVVTWTVYVDNTGYGTVYNVLVTDTLGPGLQYVGGLTTTSIVSIPVGHTVSFTVSAQVTACAGLDNQVVATWGCAGQTCQTPQTTKASIDLIPRFPHLEFVLPAFNVDYCVGSSVFTVPITNTGDGAAYSVTLPVNLTPFSVSAAPPATYSGGAFQIPYIPPGQTYNLVFTLTTPANVCTTPINGSFTFDLNYRDACAFLYGEAPQTASWQLVNTPGQLNIGKIMPGEVYREQPIPATILVSANGISGTIVVTDQVPAGLIVLDSAGGLTFTLGGNTYITWAITGSIVLTPVFAVPTGTAGCPACGQAFTNVVTATMVDCRNCQQTATAQAMTYVQCTDGLVDGQKWVSAPAPVCSSPAFTYTNVYTFANSFVVTPTWSGLIFAEALPYQSYVSGTASVFVSNGAISCSAVFSSGVVGSNLVISNINPPCNPPLPGATLIISYTTAVSETAACNDFTWYDWSYLDLGVTGNGVCTNDSVLEEGVFVQTQAPSMTLSLSGLPANVTSCGTYTVTLTAQRTSSVGAYDVVIDVPTTTYAILEVLGFDGATPVLTQTDANGYHWFYGDAFTNAVTATIQARVQVRCGSGPAPFQGTVYYESLCSNDGDYRESCSVGGTVAASSYLGPLPLLTKFPETIYATGDVVTWTLIAKNTGAAPAYNVTLTDVLGSGLSFVTATITSSLGSSLGIVMITSTNRVTWEVPVIQPKEVVTIKFSAEIVGCSDLTNRLYGIHGCLDQVCLSGGPVSSVVELPPTVLLNTNQTLSPIDTCYTRTVTATVRNAGLLSVYSATVTETLPNGLFYVVGSTEISTDTVNWQTGPDPTITGQTLVWNSASGAPLDTLLSRIRPGETVYLRFQVRASCSFAGGSLQIQTGYQDVCGVFRLTDSSAYYLSVRQANISLSKVGVNLGRASPSNTYLYGEPGETVLFTITVANATNAAPAQSLVITDALPSNLVFQSATPGYSGPAPAPLGGTITWSLPLLNPGQNAVFTVTATISQPLGCAVTDTFNVASLSWGCPDGCRLTLPTQQVRVRTRPVFDAPSITTEIAPSSLNVCGGVITVTLFNDGPPAYNVVMTNTLPGGYVFSGTVFASTPPSSTLVLGANVIYAWNVLPSGPTTVTLALRNAGTGGTCVAPSGTFDVLLLYDDDVPDCPGTGPYTTTAQLGISAVGPNLVVDKSPAWQPAQAGGTVTWTITVTNSGAGTAFNVAITDVVGTTFINPTATNGGVVAGNTITWSLSALSPGGVFTALVTAVITTTGSNRNVVTATSTCDSGCATNTVTDSAVVTLGDVFGKGPEVQTGTIGSLVVFTFTGATSDEDNVFDQVILTDVLPIGLGYVSAALTYTVDADGSQGGPITFTDVPPSSAPAAYASGNVVWNFSTLTGTVQFSGVLTAVIQNVAAAYDGGQLLNTLRLTFIDEGQAGTLTDTARVDVLEPILHLGKFYRTSYACDGALLSDNFNRTNASPPTGWLSSSGTWSNIDGIVQQTSASTSNARMVRNGFTHGELSYSAMVLSTDSTSSRGIIFRSTSSTSYYLLRMRKNDSSTALELQEMNGSFSTLASTTFTPQENRWYHLEVQVENVTNGVRIRAYVDGQLYFDVTDPSPRPAGSVGFYANSCDANACRFDDVLVTRFGRTGCYVGTNDLITYTLTISNQSRWPGYDLLITDVIPYGTNLVTYTLTSNDPTNPAVVAQPAPIPGATGVLTWRVDHLTPTVPFTTLQHTALTLTVVLQVAPWITANTVLSNQAALAYDAWITDTQPISTIVRPYSGGSHSAAVQTANGGITKSVTFAPPPTATLGTLVTYTLIVPASPVSATLYNVVVSDAVDSRLFIEAITLTGGINGAASWSGQQVTATFDAISASTQALITITARISHEFPSPASDANAGDIITNTGRMSHSTAPITTSNVVSTTVGEPNVAVAKAVQSSTGLTTGLNGLAYLTYTIRLTNTGSSPAYSVYVTDALPAGVSVTALFGGDSQSPPAAGPGTITWFVGTISNVAPAHVVVLTYTARISQALLGSLLTNTVGVRYHSLTDTIPGVRPYITATTATVRTGAPAIAKFSQPYELRIGDLITYQVVFTIPAGTAWGGSPGDVLVDVLPQGVWYITDTETLTHTPSTINVTITQRISNTTDQPGHQTIRWSFAPITSPQDMPTVVTLTFRAQAVGLRIDTLAPVWITQTERFWPTNYVQLEYPWPNHVSATVTNMLIQPRLTIDKHSVPAPGSFVGAGDLITYTLTITNDGYGPAYDLIVADVLPPGLTLVTATVGISAPPTATLFAQPPVSATGLLTWHVGALWGRQWNGDQPATAVITVVARVTDTIGANLALTNTASVTSYDSQPGDGPGPYAPDERAYGDGSDGVTHQTPDGALLKSVVPATATLGSLVTYTLIVPATPMTATLYTVTVTDQLDPKLQLHAVADGPDGTVVVAGNAFTVTYPAVPAGEQRWITVTAVLSSPLGAVAGNALTNVATLRHQDGGPTPSNQTTLTVTEPSLTLVKSSDPPTSSTVGAGQTVTYTVRITNATGAFASTAYDLVFSDTLPLHMRDAAPNVVGITVDGAPVGGSQYVTTYNALSGLFFITFTTGLGLPPGGQLVITYTVTVDADAPAGLDQINAASATWSSLPGAVPGDRNYGPITGSTNVHLGFPAFDLRKTFTPTVVEAGGWLTYTLIVTNVGVVSATGVVITDAVPVNTGFVNCAPVSCGVSGGVVSWTLGTLNVGQSRVVTLVVQVTSPLPNGTLIFNTGYVTSTEGITDTDTVTTGVGSLPILNLTKSSQDGNGSPLQPGDTLSYTLVVLNTGNATATGVVISDIVPANAIYKPGSIAGGDARSDSGLPLLSWTINALLPHTPVTLTFAVTVNWPLTNGLNLVNTAVVTSGQTPTPTSSTVTDTVVSSHTLQVAKSAQPESVGAGDLLTYTIAYTVTGDAPAYGVTLSDTTPANTTFYAATPPASVDPGTGNAGAVVWLLGDLLPAGSQTTFVSGVVTLVVQVTSPLVSGTLVANTALLTDTSGLTDTDMTTTTVTSSHALTLTKEAQPSVGVAGQRITYTLTYTVAGNEPAFNVVITDVLPSGVTFESCTPACGVGSGVITWSLGTLNPVTSAQVQLVALVGSDVPSGTLLLNSAVIGDSGGLTDTDEVVTPVEAVANLRLQKYAEPSPASAGGWLTYTVVVTNDGPSLALDVTVTDVLPAEVSYIGASPAPASMSGNVLTWTLGALLPGQTTWLTVTVQVSAALASDAQITNTAGVTTSTAGDDPLDNADSVTTPITTTAEIALSKRSNVPFVAPGSLLTYTLVVTNLGPSLARNVLVTDVLPTEVTYHDAVPSPATIGAGTLTWALGDLDVGQSVMLTVVVRVSPLVTLNQPFTNTATATTDTPGDDPTNNNAETPVTPIQPQVAIQKDLIGADLDLVTPNHVTFTIRVTNTGPSAISRLRIEDQFDSNVLSYTTAMPEPDAVSPGQLMWDDLTGAPPYGYGTPLPPGQSYVITVVLLVITDVVNTTNIASVAEGTEDEHGNPTNLPEDDAEVINVPTAVTLRAFYVVAVSDRTVRLAWETETEQNSFTFHIYRAPVNDFTQASLVGVVPAMMGGASGASYTFDDVVPSDGAWWYWLADVDTSGRETVHASPVRADAGPVPDGAAAAYRLWLPVVMRME